LNIYITQGKKKTKRRDHAKGKKHKYILKNKEINRKIKWKNIVAIYSI
jgi:hypothetical protein